MMTFPTEWKNALNHQPARVYDRYTYRLPLAKSSLFFYHWTTGRSLQESNVAGKYPILSSMSFPQKNLGKLNRFH